MCPRRRREARKVEKGSGRRTIGVLVLVTEGYPVAESGSERYRRWRVCVLCVVIAI